MIKNYFTIAWRNLVKSRTFSIINITGLAIGLSSFLLISLYVLDELSYDRYNEKADRIYRIHTDLRFGGTDLHLPVASDPMGEALKIDYPQVEEYTRIYGGGNKLVKKGNEFINEDNTAHADSTFFNVFTLPAITGDMKTALNEPNTVVIAASTAKKYFGSLDALGKTIETDDNGRTVYKVTGIFKDIPHNSHFHLDFIFSMKNVDYQWGNFLSNNFFTYILLKKGTDYKVFEKNFPQFIDKHVVPQAAQLMNIKSMKEFEKEGNKLTYSLMPLTKIHLHSDFSFDLSPSGNIQYVYIFSAVALFILIIACINFMNLTTARSAKRAREVGIRKVLGTDRRRLVGQFLTESTLMAVLSLLLAIGIAYFILPLFNNLANKSMTLQSLFSSRILPLLIALPFIVGLMAGSYPAFYLSAFKPIEVLKGKLNPGNKSQGLRSGLVVFQFFASIFLIIATMVIFRQLNFIRTTNLGFNKDQVMIVNNAYALDKNLDAFKNELLQLPGVQSATISGYLPVSSWRSDNTFSKEAVLDSKSGLNAQVWSIDYDYLKTMGMQLAKGRNFSKDFGADSSAIIINETMAKILGYDDPVNKKVYGFLGNSNEPPVPVNIIGVVKDFHFESLRRNIEPLCFRLGRATGSACFKIAAAHIPEVLKAAEKEWKTMASGKPYSYQFMDESFDRMYRDEQRVGKIAMLFSILAIFIACLGLFGLATFIAEQRTKEIGIRKVMGASTTGLVELLSRDFLKLVLISFMIAVPFSWWCMHTWLQDFAYRINIGWSVFAIAGIAAMFIALLTVSFQAIRAAVANPAKSLRTE
jgi:putative ABC transport system permease protein